MNKFGFGVFYFVLATIILALTTFALNAVYYDMLKFVADMWGLNYTNFVYMLVNGGVLTTVIKLTATFSIAFFAFSIIYGLLAIKFTDLREGEKGNFIFGNLSRNFTMSVISLSQIFLFMIGLFYAARYLLHLIIDSDPVLAFDIVIALQQPEWIISTLVAWFGVSTVAAVINIR